MATGTQLLPEAADTEHIAAALRRHNALGHVSVRRVEVASARSTIFSRITRLRLDYDGDADGAPRSLILKTRLAERDTGGWNGGRQEVAFYRDIAAKTPRIVPRCFDAHWDANTNDWHLLLEDLTETHATPTIWPLPPGVEQCEHIIRARARFHAAWWGDTRLGTSVGTLRNATGVDQMLRDLTQHLGQIVDVLSPERRALFETLLAARSLLLRRYQARASLTIVHGDAHVWNCFLPRDGSDDVRLFDWDSWRVGVAASDLAYMMAVHWYPDRRRQVEHALLDRYHATLMAEGVRSYDRDDLDHDYRWAVVWQMTTPVWQAVGGVPPVIWWNNLERVSLAFDDLGCRDLLT